MRTVQVGRCQKKIEAFQIGGWTTPATLHIAATDPVCFGGYSDLVTIFFLAHHSAHGMGAMIMVIARDVDI